MKLLLSFAFDFGFGGSRGQPIPPHIVVLIPEFRAVELHVLRIHVEEWVLWWVNSWQGDGHASKHSEKCDGL